MKLRQRQEVLLTEYIPLDLGKPDCIKPIDGDAFADPIACKPIKGDILPENGEGLTGIIERTGIRGGGTIVARSKSVV